MQTSQTPSEAISLSLTKEENYKLWLVTTGNISNRELARSFLRQVINFSLFPSATKIFTTLPTT